MCLNVENAVTGGLWRGRCGSKAELKIICPAGLISGTNFLSRHLERLWLLFGRRYSV